MSTAQFMTDLYSAGDLRCPRCSEVLPAEALFCPICGERMSKHTDMLAGEQDEFTLRYRKTTLLRRRPYVNLFLAVDTERQRPVAIRDIDVSCLDEHSQAQAFTIIKQEYDLLRRLTTPIPLLMPAIDIGSSQDHLLTIMGDPVFISRMHTLHNVLQSGIGLPKMSVALHWIYELCTTLDELHRHQMVIGDIDPRMVILKENDYTEMPVLLISWLPAALAGMLPPLTPESHVANTTSFLSPEALQGKLDTRSDVYSLGALLYLLLTGQPPEGAVQRSRYRLLSPCELNTQVSGKLDKIVMRALSLEPTERYQSALALQEALAPLCANHRERLNGKNSNRSIAMTRDFREDQLSVDAPLDEVARERDNEVDTLTVSNPVDEDAVHSDASSPPVSLEESQSPAVPDTEFPHVPTLTPAPTIDELEQDDEGDEPVSDEEEDMSVPTVVVARPGTTESPSAEEEDMSIPTVVVTRSGEAQSISTDEDDMSVPTVVVSRTHSEASSPSAPESEETAVEMPARPVSEMSQDEQEDALTDAGIPSSRALVPYRAAVSQSRLVRNVSQFLRRVRDVLVGEQRLDVAAAAVIETPLRVMPDQAYTIRIQLMGRDAGDTLPVSSHASNGVKPEKNPSGGLSSLAQGDLVVIEVRSAIYERYAYVVQRAEVTVPAAGYAAEVTIPMRPFSQGPSGRRDRLHIFFLDELRRPIYEKPFVVELFISHRVQPGREGHNVLSIPV